MNKKIISNIFSLYTVQFSNLFLPLLIFPYLVRTLGTTNFGLIIFAQAIVQYMILTTDYGFNLSATRKIAVANTNGENISTLFWSTFFAKLIIFFFCLITFAISLAVIPKLQKDWIIYVSVLPALLGSLLQSQFYYQGLEYFKPLAGIVVITRLLSFPFILLLVTSELHSVRAALLLSAGPFFSGLILFIYAIKSKTLFFLRPQKSRIVEQMKDGFHLFTSSAAVSLYTNTNPVILGFLVNTEAVAYYTAAERIIRVIQGAIGPIGQAVFPRISALIHSSRTEAMSFIKKILWIQATAGFFLSSGLFIMSDLIIRTVWTDSMLPAVSTLKIMSFVPFIVSLSNILGIQLMLPLGYSQAFSRIIIISGIFNLGILIPFALFANENGAALAMLLTECLVTISMYYILRKKDVL